MGSQFLQLVFVAFAAIYACQWIHPAHGQGLDLPATGTTQLGAAGVEYQKLEARYKRVQGIKATYKEFSRQQQAQAATKCNAADGFLCAANTNSADKEFLKVLLMAASPDVFDSRSDSSQTNPVSPPGDQGECNSCVGFAVAAAAEAAVASTLQIKGSNVALSVQDLQYCDADEKGDVELARGCVEGWTLRSALNKLKKQPPVHESCLPYGGANINENTRCSYCTQREYDQYASLGTFMYSAVEDFADVQQAIRDSGGVVTAMNQVNIQHMRDFFTANPKGIYRGSPANMSTEGHAVYVIGYSNTGSFWLVKNSFGTGFADDGFMRVAYGTAGIMPPDQTFKVIFTPRKTVEVKKLCVVEDPQRQGCFRYTAQAKDYMGRVAKEAGIKSLPKFLLDNSGIVQDLDKPLTGLQLLVCDPQSRRITNCAVSKAGTLMLAASPQVYSSTNPQQVGPMRLVATAGNQGTCATVVAFAVAAAAETAMASTLRVDVQRCSISVQALAFCPASGLARTCRSGWGLPDALSDLEQRSSSLPTAACLPYNPELKELCKGVCTATNEFAKQGRFSSVQINTMWQAQRHIRQYGSVVTRFDVYSDLDSFIQKSPKAVYKQPGQGYMWAHVVVLVGYNNDERYWIAKNSWGPRWGDGGFFKVAFGVDSVLTEAYGIIWTPNQPVPATQLPVTSAAPQRPGCYWYKAGPLDYLSRVAWLAGIPLDQFILDNSAIVKTLDAPLTGLQLLLCKPKPGTVSVSS